MGGVPSVGVFLKDPNPYLRNFWLIIWLVEDSKADCLTRELGLRM